MPGASMPDTPSATDDSPSRDTAPTHSGTDPTFECMMETTFGPPDGKGTEDRIARGMQAVEQLSMQSDGLQWLHCEYSPIPDAVAADEVDSVCFGCGGAGAKSRCAKCSVATYCSRSCQVSDWKGGRGGHKAACARLKQLGRNMEISDSSLRRTVVAELLGRVRLYLCPFAVHHRQAVQQRGFVLVQSECTLAELALPSPKDTRGRNLACARSILLQHVTLEEMSTTPELAAGFDSVRAPLEKAVQEHDEEKEVLVLLRTRCGLLALVTTLLVPEMRVCLALASDYEGQDGLQIDIDAD